jgi:hypothetical protein
MELLPVRPIQFSWENEGFQQKRRRFLLDELAPKKRVKKKDSRILDLVLERLSLPHFNYQGSLLATLTTPQVQFSVLSEPPIYKQPKKIIHLLKDAQKFITPRKENTVLRPIGINRCEYNNWINALMQFIVFIPSLSEMFAYTPKSLSPFIEFIAQYRKDQDYNKSVTLASSAKILESFRKKFSINVFQKENPVQHFCEILKLLMDSVHLGGGFEEMEEIDLLALHPDWRIDLQLAGSLTWEEKIEKHFKLCGFFEKADLDLFLPFPKELLVSLQNTSQPFESTSDKVFPKKQFFLSYLGTPCSLYEMNAFVEYRPDGSDKGDYITYVKAEGDWLQCDDTRVILLRPSNLSIPLRRSFLFHYKKVK